MRLLYLNQQGELALTKDLATPAGPYAILSHTWGRDEDEVTFEDIENTPETSGTRSRRRWFSRMSPPLIKKSMYKDKTRYKKL